MKRPWLVFTALAVLCGGNSLGRAKEPESELFLGRSAQHYAEATSSAQPSARGAAAWALAQLAAAAKSELLAAAKHDDPVVRYWAVRGIAKALATTPSDDLSSALRTRLDDSSAAPRLAAAEEVGRLGDLAAALPLLEAGLKSPVEGVQIQAVSALLALGPAAQPLLPAIREANQNGSEYVKRISTRILANLGEANGANQPPAKKAKKAKQGQ